MENREKLLIKALMNRDRNTFRLLYETYHASLFRFAETYLCCPGLSEDIVQEVFLKLWEEPKVQINQSLKAYLFFMVRNRCIDYLRSIQIEDKKKLKLKEALIVADAVELNLDDQVSKEIRSAIEELPTQCKSVYKMSVLYGLKHAEIAEELDISVDSVKVQMFRARKTLRNKLSHLRELLLLFSNLYKTVD